MRLKRFYTSREVAALTGLTARQLQWWDARRLFVPAIGSHPTEAGGFTERRYTPLDVLELQVLADLRRRGLSVPRLRALLATWPEIAVVGEATDGQDAVRQVAECQPDVVLMDLHMPVLDGVQATQLIKQRWPNIIVIVLTMYSVEQPAAMAAGADAFLIKGSAPERLLSALGVNIADASR